jgi:NAD(P)-dependent dehydrogenase (short-subunit alcohol dehydrogenase family)
MSKKVVLITGTNSGFGWLTAHSVAALGHQVYATMRNTKGKNADRATALAALANVTVLDVDLTDDESVKQAVEGIVAKEGSTCSVRRERLCTLEVHQAGIACYAPTARRFNN